MFCLFFVFVLMHYLCEKYYKPITIQFCIADCVSWVPWLTGLDFTNKLDLWTQSQNRAHSHVGHLDNIYLLRTFSLVGEGERQHTRRHSEFNSSLSCSFMELSFHIQQVFEGFILTSCYMSIWFPSWIAWEPRSRDGVLLTLLSHHNSERFHNPYTIQYSLL